MPPSPPDPDQIAAAVVHTFFWIACVLLPVAALFVASWPENIIEDPEFHPWLVPPPE